MYQNPVINAPLGPDGFPAKVDERKAQQEFEVGGSRWLPKNGLRLCMQPEALVELSLIGSG
jgi:hypothetical protein